MTSINLGGGRGGEARQEIPYRDLVPQGQPYESVRALHIMDKIRGHFFLVVLVFLSFLLSCFVLWLLWKGKCEGLSVGCVG